MAAQDTEMAAQESVVQLRENYLPEILEHFDKDGNPLPHQSCSVDCAICREPLAIFQREDDTNHAWSCLPCGHVFGYKCIKRWFVTNTAYPDCPCCRQSMAHSVCGHKFRVDKLQPSDGLNIQTLMPASNRVSPLCERCNPNNTHFHYGLADDGLAQQGFDPSAIEDMPYPDDYWEMELDMPSLHRLRQDLYELRSYERSLPAGSTVYQLNDNYHDIYPPNQAAEDLNTPAPRPHRRDERTMPPPPLDHPHGYPYDLPGGRNAANAPSRAEIHAQMRREAERAVNLQREINALNELDAQIRREAEEARFATSYHLPHYHPPLPAFRPNNSPAATFQPRPIHTRAPHYPSRPQITGGFIHPRVPPYPSRPQVTGGSTSGPVEDLYLFGNQSSEQLRSESPTDSPLSPKEDETAESELHSTANTEEQIPLDMLRFGYRDLYQIPHRPSSDLGAPPQHRIPVQLNMSSREADVRRQRNETLAVELAMRAQRQNRMMELRAAEYGARIRGGNEDNDFIRPLRRHARAGSDSAL